MESHTSFLYAEALKLNTIWNFASMNARPHDRQRSIQNSKQTVFFFFLMSLNIMLGLNVTPYANIRWATTIATESEHNMLVLSAETQFSRGF